MGEMITLEVLNRENQGEALGIDREDISLDFVDSVEDIIELTRYGEEHGCIGHTYLIRYEDRCVGFIIYRAYRRRGIGSYVLEEVIGRIYREFGPRPILIGCHVDNAAAMKMYQKHDFVNTFAMDEDDYFMIREG